MLIACVEHEAGEHIMAAIADGSGTGKFRVGAAIGKSLKILGRNIVPFILLALILNSPLQILSLILHFFDVESPESVVTSETIDFDEVGLTVIAIGLVVAIGYVLLSFLLSATLVYGTIMDLRGGKAGIWECMSRGFGLLLPVIGVGILVALIVIVCVPFLIIPAIIAFVVLWVAIPAAVVERPGVLASLSRSAELTKGNRWRIFGMLLVLALISFVISLILGAIAVAVGFGAGGEAFEWLAWVLNVFLEAVFAALFAVASAVVYHDLRVAKEGADVEQIAAVFD